MRKLFGNLVCLCVYLFLAVFYVQLYDGFNLLIFGWRSSLPTSYMEAISETTVLSLASLSYIYVANTFIVGLNQLKLGIACGLSMFVYIYALKSDLILTLFLVLTNKTSVTIFLVLVLLPILVGAVFDRLVRVGVQNRYSLHGVLTKLRWF